MRNFRILLVSNCNSSFVRNDLKILSQRYQVEIVDSQIITRNPITGLRTILNLMQGVCRSDLVLAWFGNLHALVAVILTRLFRKKSVIVIGGFEVAAIEEIGYGACFNPVTKAIIASIFRLCDRIAVVDESLKTEAMNIFDIDGEKIAIIPTGHDGGFYTQLGEKERCVITVGYLSGSNYRRKGLDLFARTAGLVDDAEFVLIGANEDADTELLRRLAKGNLVILPPVSQEELRTYYRKAKVYCQFSMHEGLPSSLCEAMLCECVPVGTKVNGIITAIGDTGFLLTSAEAEIAAEAVKSALNSDSGCRARSRIVCLFPLARRELQLSFLISELLGTTEENPRTLES